MLIETYAILFKDSNQMAFVCWNLLGSLRPFGVSCHELRVSHNLNKELNG